jgi:hypothetical protein
LPHVWIEPGVSVHDRIGDGYTVLDLGNRRGDTATLARALADLGAPFATLELNSPAARDVYGYDFILLRPDLHVVWRGNRPPDDPAGLAALATGRSTHQ